MLSSYIEIGDYVEQDEEIATIETDKVRELSKNEFSSLLKQVLCPDRCCSQCSGTRHHQGISSQ